MPKPTKLDLRWGWLADRIWRGTRTGWAASQNLGKGDLAILERRVKAGQVERDDYGMVRLTDFGRAELTLIDTGRREAADQVSI